jgi:hypothetical protein
MSSSQHKLLRLCLRSKTHYANVLHLIVHLSFKVERDFSFDMHTKSLDEV